MHTNSVQILFLYETVEVIKCFYSFHSLSFRVDYCSDGNREGCSINFKIIFI